MGARTYTATTNPVSIHWWALAIRGLIGITFGILTILWPGITLAYFIYLFGIFALLDGTFSVVAALRAHQGHDRWWGLLLAGIVSILAGIATFLYPGITALTLVYLVAIWAIWAGVFQIVAAIRLRKQITGEWMLVAGGVFSILFGALLTMAPTLGLLTFVLWIGVFAIVTGILITAAAFRLRSWETRTLGSSGTLKHA